MKSLFSCKYWHSNSARASLSFFSVSALCKLFLSCFYYGSLSLVILPQLIICRIKYRAPIFCNSLSCTKTIYYHQFEFHDLCNKVFYWAINFLLPPIKCCVLKTLICIEIPQGVMEGWRRSSWSGTNPHVSGRCLQ